MQPPTFREIRARLKQEGYVLAGCRGSHAKFVCGPKTVVVNGTGADRPTKGTWANIKRQAGW